MKVMHLRCLRPAGLGVSFKVFDNYCTQFGGPRVVLLSLEQSKEISKGD